jgi:hypothetical protein
MKVNIKQKNAVGAEQKVSYIISTVAFYLGLKPTPSVATIVMHPLGTATHVAWHGRSCVVSCAVLTKDSDVTAVNCMTD